MRSVDGQRPVFPARGCQVEGRMSCHHKVTQLMGNRNCHLWEGALLPAQEAARRWVIRGVCVCVCTCQEEICSFLRGSRRNKGQVLNKYPVIWGTGSPLSTALVRWTFSNNTRGLWLLGENQRAISSWTWLPMLISPVCIFSGELSAQVCCPLSGLFIFMLVGFQRSSYILGTNPLSDPSSANTSSQSPSANGNNSITILFNEEVSLWSPAISTPQRGTQS